MGECYMLKGKTVVLGVCGGIAAYKAAALCSKLVQAGANVRVIMTESATKLVQPLTFQSLSKNHVMVDTFAEWNPSVVMHINVADSADLVVIAPATANILAKMAYGMADDLLSTVLLAVRAPILVSPAMNVNMYAHPTVQQNIVTLQKRGVHFIEPGEGMLACGYVGKGRMAEPEEIMEALKKLATPDQPLQGKKVLVTAGGTVERIDPVRYLTNDSSGKMGFAVAEAARDMGAEVTVVAARTSVPAPAGVSVVKVESALDMRDAVMERLADTDIVVKAAAVADYRPVEQADRKIKKHGDTLPLTLVKNPDILQEIGERKTHQFTIGFAAETHPTEEMALDKLLRKNCDLLVVNDVTEEGAGFGTDTNIIRIYDRNGLVEALPLLSKREAAERLLQTAAERFSHGRSGENAAVDVGSGSA